MALNLPLKAPVASDPAPAPSPTGERSYLIDEAARLLGVSRRTVYYRIREGRLRTVRAKCGSQRVLASSIVALLNEGDALREARTAPVVDRSKPGADEAYQQDRQKASASTSAPIDERR